MDRVIIFDTTLRDGEQSPGATLNMNEKIEVAKQLAKLGVDVIEAGFPISSPGDFNAVKAIAQQVKGPAIAGLARANRKDIDAVWEAVKYSDKPRIHTFIATSDIHLEYKLRKSREEVLKITDEMVKYARSLCEDVEFSAEDAGRSDPDYLCQVVETAINAGATTINIPDTVGYTVPSEFGALIKYVMDNVPNVDKAIISVHCHNDLGMATANTIAALANGARQVECTINGLGERAGNCSLEEIAMILKTRKDKLNLYSTIDTTQIYKTSRLVSNLTGMLIQPNKAIVGANAFSHESGIHQDGVLKYRTTYEIMNPVDIGLVESQLPLGPRSGRHALKARLEELGYELKEEELHKAFERFKILADKKKKITNRDLEYIVADELRFSAANTEFKLEHIQVSCGDHALPTATVRLEKTDGEIVQDAAIGAGPIDAVYQAINRIIDVPNELIEFSIQAITEGLDALGEVTIRVKSEDGSIYTGNAANVDILVAAAHAYVNALNKLVSKNAVLAKPTA
ncbi:MAG: 2-isopropylmalate synthase [Cyanobacteriota bacterium]